MKDPDDIEHEAPDPMTIATAPLDMPQSEQDVWSALRSYLNLQVPLAAVLRRPYSFLNQGDRPQEEQGGRSATVLQFRKPGNKVAPSTEDQKSYCR